MATRTMTIELRGEQRADGCYHLKSPELPGFHFIVGPEEQSADYEEALYSALRTFIPNYMKARARQADRTFTITRRRPQLNFTAELEFA